MNVIIQVPCLNEADTLHEVVADLPFTIAGVDSIETLVIDDGSRDGTAAVALGLGVDHVVRHRRNRGLAAAFSTGLDACLRLGADIIVNTDGDGQYSGADIQKLIEPILAGRADMVIGDRRPSEDMRQSWLKRKLQRLGSRMVSWLAGREIPDAVSGFRAMSREAALKMQVVTEFSYTIETVLLACSQGLAIEHVPTTTNTVTRPSRLFRSIPQFVLRSGLTMLRVTFLYRPLATLMTAGGLLGIVGMIPILRFLYLAAGGNSAGHIQSLVLGGVLLVLAAILAVAGLLADLMAANRKLLGATLEKMKRLESGDEKADTVPNVGRKRGRASNVVGSRPIGIFGDRA